MAGKILIVDDEKNIVDILEFNLRKEGYTTLAAYDGASGLEMARAENPDLILLDVMLPKMDGFEVCREFRKQNFSTPVIMLTAREEETDKVFGLELGADDYITKPFSIREVMARVKTNIRRAISIQGISTDIKGRNAIVSGNLSIDPERIEVKKNDKPVELTQLEFDLLKFMASQPGKVFSREQLMQDVWQYDYLGDLRAVDVAVRRLREKIEDDPATPTCIITKRGAGYYFAD